MRKALSIRVRASPLGGRRHVTVPNHKWKAKVVVVEDGALVGKKPRLRLRDEENSAVPPNPMNCIFWNCQGLG